MNTRRYFVMLLGLAVAVGASTAAAQSLGNLARKQREQRGQQARKPAKVLTNEDVETQPTSEGPTAAAGMAEELKSPDEETLSTLAETSNEPSELMDPGEEAAGDKKKSREYWQGAFKAAKAKIAAAEEVQRLVEDELGLLQIQRARELSPTVQAELDGRISSQTAAVEAKRNDTTKAKQALEELEQKFEESGAPADWSKTE